MVSEWPPVLLEDLVEIKHGYAFQGEFFSDVPLGDILLTPGNFAVGGGFKGDKFKYYRGPVPTNFVLAPGDLLVTMTDLSKAADTLGYPALVPKSRTRFLHNQRIGKVQIKHDADLDIHFLYFLLCTQGYRNEVLASATGTTVKHTSPTRIGKFSFRRPSLDEQRAIANVLRVLDHKIESNRKINETLEAMARALFKSWFVDFDPVRAKEEGLDTGMPTHIAALFPDEFIDTLVGRVPKGWDVTRWGTVATLEYGKSLSGYGTESGVYPVYGTNGRIGTCSEPLCPYPGVIIGRKGAYRGVHYSPSPFFVIDTAFYVAPKMPIELRWAYYEIQRNDINNMDSGSAIPSTSREDFYSLPVVAPPTAVQRAFTQLLEPLWQKQEHNLQCSLVLASLRKTLLPTLISGEVRVPSFRSRRGA